MDVHLADAFGRRLSGIARQMLLRGYEDIARDVFGESVKRMFWWRRPVRRMHWGVTRVVGPDRMALCGLI